jgi:hypothetical protein
MAGNAGRLDWVYRGNASDDGAHRSDAPYLDRKIGFFVR